MKISKIHIEGFRSIKGLNWLANNGPEIAPGELGVLRATGCPSPSPASCG